MVKPHWHILGAGAIGCLYANALHASGCNITLVMRPGTLQDSVLLIVEGEDTRTEQQMNVITPDSTTTISHLLVTTKAYDVRAAVAGVAHLLTAESVVVLLVNGMGLVEQIARDWPHLNIYSGTTTEGAYCIDA